MNLHELVFDALSGGSPEARIYPDVLPQMVILPATTFIEVGGNDDFHLLGPSGLLIRYVQVDCWAGTRLSANQLSLALREKMLAYGGFQVNAIDVPGAESWEQDTKRYRASLEYTLWIQS